MRDNNLRVGLESADQIIAMTERGLGSAKEVSEKLKEYGITRVLASISPLYLELQKLLRNELCGNSSPLCNNNAGSSSNGDILKNDMEIFENMERLIKETQMKHVAYGSNANDILETKKQIHLEAKTILKNTEVYGVIKDTLDKWLDQVLRIGNVSSDPVEISL